MKLNYKYEDIIHLQPPASRKHPPMSLAKRAAQFAPFAALTGHEDAVLQAEQEATQAFYQNYI